MAKARAIIKRRRAVQNIRKITRTMQLIATARFQAAMKRAAATRPYTEKIAELVRQLSRGRSLDHPLLRVNTESKRTVLIVITSNRGLCGAYNGLILREASKQLKELRQTGQKVDLIVSGKKGIGYFNFQNQPIATELTVFEHKPQFAEIEPIATAMMDAYIRGNIDAVFVTHMHFESSSQQYVETTQLLPLRLTKQTGESQPDTVAERYEFSPPAEQLLAELLPQTVRLDLFHCFIDAAVSEQVGRMVAMKAATDAAAEMIKRLTQQYNHARQTQITLELLDIVGGAEALK